MGEIASCVSQQAQNAAFGNMCLCPGLWVSHVSVRSAFEQMIEHVLALQHAIVFLDIGNRDLLPTLSVVVGLMLSFDSRALTAFGSSCQA